MSKRRKILLCAVAAIVIIGLATGALTLGDIVGSLFGEKAVQAVDSLQQAQGGEYEIAYEEEQEQLQQEQPSQPPEEQPQTQQPVIDENGTFTSKEDVALYIHTYGHLPSNFITKSQARELGWDGGSVEDYAPGCSIGGDRFGNYEGILPQGKKYTECDIDTLGRSSRGAKRIVFSNDGCIYYTEDHYESFELLYGEE
ncbi:MAG: ribonuclease [Clostridia bacterium]|nr:ribonuclease [Clostridia bacterium]